jgi:hypothetical protein
MTTKIKQNSSNIDKLKDSQKSSFDTNFEKRMLYE